MPMSLELNVGHAPGLFRISYLIPSSTQIRLNILTFLTYFFHKNTHFKYRCYCLLCSICICSLLQICTNEKTRLRIKSITADYSAKKI
jgi:hypothetical protein